MSDSHETGAGGGDSLLRKFMVDGLNQLAGEIAVLEKQSGELLNEIANRRLTYREIETWLRHDRTAAVPPETQARIQPTQAPAPISTLEPVPAAAQPPVHNSTRAPSNVVPFDNPPGVVPKKGTTSYEKGLVARYMAESVDTKARLYFLVRMFEAMPDGQAVSTTQVVDSIAKGRTGGPFYTLVQNPDSLRATINDLFARYPEIFIREYGKGGLAGGYRITWSRTHLPWVAG